jgi:putative transposase
MAQTCGHVVVHLIFSTKQRKPPITAEARSDLFAYLGGIVREMRATALIINGTCDHVHMLVRIRPSQSVAEIARVIKINSGCHQVHRNAGRTPQEAFFSGRVSGVPEEK